MKTNQVMIRKIGNLEVNQRTSDSMFNATKLLKQWNREMGMKKEVADFFKLDSVKEFISALIIEENFTGDDSPYVKSKASRGVNAGTWMHPILFTKFAMWINPRFEVKVLKFVYDNLIAFRHDVGDDYKILCSALDAIGVIEYKYAIMQINKKVFGYHEKGMRNIATVDELNKLRDEQTFLVKLVEGKFITTAEQFFTSYNSPEWMIRANQLAIDTAEFFTIK